MTILFLASFIGGLLFAVRIMLFGVERPRPFGSEGEASFRLTPAVIAAFLIVFGFAGYVALRTGAGQPATLLIAGVAGLAAAAAAAQMVRRWWAITPEHDPDDPRYVLQGHVARVARAIPAGDGGEGEIEFEVEDQRRLVRARSVDGQAVDAGTEVVIERIDDDLAYVEPWVIVEKRL
jgi:membrane protein implicated in regulation of membrane protease activity